MPADSMAWCWRGVCRSLFVSQGLLQSPPPFGHTWHQAIWCPWSGNSCSAAIAFCRVRREDPWSGWWSDGVFGIFLAELSKDIGPYIQNCWGNFSDKRSGSDFLKYELVFAADIRRKPKNHILQFMYRKRMLDIESNFQCFQKFYR